MHHLLKHVTVLPNLILVLFIFFNPFFDNNYVSVKPSLKSLDKFPLVFFFSQFLTGYVPFISQKVVVGKLFKLCIKGSLALIENGLRFFSPFLANGNVHNVELLFSLLYLFYLKEIGHAIRDLFVMTFVWNYYVFIHNFFEEMNGLILPFDLAVYFLSDHH